VHAATADPFQSNHENSRIGFAISRRAGCHAGRLDYPKLLILDEPSAGLAPVVIDRILNVAAAECARGMAVLLVEQLVDKALRHAHFCYVVETGRIALASTPAELRGSDVLKHIYLGGKPPVKDI